MRKLLAAFLVCVIVKTSGVAQPKNVKHIIFIGVDGMGGYAVDRPGNTTLRMMMKKGAYSLKAQSCLPSSSAPNWASHFMGSGPEQHGYTKWNSKTPENPSTVKNEYGLFPTIFYAIKKDKPILSTAVVYEWDGISYLYEKECVDKQADGDGDVETINKAIKVVEENKPAFLFVHLNSPDSAGHSIGFNSTEFYTKVRNADTYIAQIIEATKRAGIFDNTLFLVSADHGGKGKEHGGDTPVERQIPWIWYGKTVRKKGEIKRNITVYDTAPTIAWLLRVQSQKEWIGSAVKEVF